MIVNVINPPHRSYEEWDKNNSERIRSIFLAGSIEMGKAEDWQTRLVTFLKHKDNVVEPVEGCPLTSEPARRWDGSPIKINAFNPRRPDWDNGWSTTINSPEFNQQVTWELDMLRNADVIALYFDPKTQSPISLLELGMFAHTGKMIVCCPEGFWRKGNVDIVCARAGVPIYNNFDAFKLAVKDKLLEISRNTY